MGFKLKRLVKSAKKVVKSASKAAGQVLKVATPVIAGALAATGVGLPIAAGIAAAGSAGGAILAGGSASQKFKSFKQRAVGSAAAVAGGALIGATGIFSGASSAVGAAQAAGVGGSATAAPSQQAGGDLANNQPLQPGEPGFVGPLTQEQQQMADAGVLNPYPTSSPNVLDRLFNVGENILNRQFPNNSAAPGSTGSSDPRNQTDQTVSPQIDSAEDGTDEFGRPKKKDNMKTYLLIGGAALVLLLLLKKRK